MRPTAKQYQKAKGGRFIPSESKLQDQVCKYLKVAYPQALFKVDFGAGALLTGRQAGQQRRQQAVRGWPDIFIAEPRHGFSGLFIELKVENAKIYKSNGLFFNEHLENQANVMEKLKARGFYCCFCKGFDAAKVVIDNWFDQYKLLKFTKS